MFCNNCPSTYIKCTTLNITYMIYLIPYVKPLQWTISKIYNSETIDFIFDLDIDISKNDIVSLQYT